MKLLRKLLRTPSPSRHERGVQIIVMQELRRYGAAYHMDTYGNIVVRIGEEPKTLFTGHMDCIHNHHPVTIKEFEGFVDKESVGRVIALADKCKQRALGADDVVGVRMMLRLIKEKVKGLYIFTVEEECGCHGASHAAKWCPDYVQHAVTFDRRDVNSIITSMSGGTCCHDDFADALIKAFDMGHTKDTGGSITDTEKFRSKTLNHTNISAGYYREHSKEEWMSVEYVEKLLERVTEVDWEGLPATERPATRRYGGWNNNNYVRTGDRVQKIIDEAASMEEALGKTLVLVKEAMQAPYFTKPEFVAFIESLQFLMNWDSYTEEHKAEKKAGKE